MQQYTDTQTHARLSQQHFRCSAIGPPVSSPPAGIGQARKLAAAVDQAASAAAMQWQPAAVLSSPSMNGMLHVGEGTNGVMHEHMQSKTNSPNETSPPARFKPGHFALSPALNAPSSPIAVSARLDFHHSTPLLSSSPSTSPPAAVDAIAGAGVATCSVQLNHFAPSTHDAVMSLRQVNDNCRMLQPQPPQQSVPPMHPRPVPLMPPSSCLQAPDSPDQSPTAEDLWSGPELLPSPQTVWTSPFKPPARALPVDLLAAQQQHQQRTSQAHGIDHDSIMMEPLQEQRRLSAPLPSPSPTDHMATLAAAGRSLLLVPSVSSSSASASASSPSPFSSSSLVSSSVLSTPSPSPPPAPADACSAATSAVAPSCAAMVLPPAEGFAFRHTGLPDDDAAEDMQQSQSQQPPPQQPAASSTVADDAMSAASVVAQPISSSQPPHLSGLGGLLVRSTSLGGNSHGAVVVAAATVPLMPPLPSWCGLPQPHLSAPSASSVGIHEAATSSSSSSSSASSSPSSFTKRMKITPLSSPSSSRAPRMMPPQAGTEEHSEHTRGGAFQFDASPLVSNGLFSQQLTAATSSNLHDSSPAPLRSPAPLHPAPSPPLVSSSSSPSPSPPLQQPHQLVTAAAVALLPNSSSTVSLSALRFPSPRHSHSSPRHSSLGLGFGSSSCATSAAGGAAASVPVPNYWWELQIVPAASAPGANGGGKSSSGAAAPERIQLWTRACWLLGRHTSCDVVLEHISISRLHARLLIHSASGQLYLQDLDSTHGTFVNGARVLGMKKAALEGNAQAVAMDDPNSEHMRGGGGGGLTSFTLAATPSPSAAGAVPLVPGSRIVFGANNARVYVVVQHDSMPPPPPTTTASSESIAPSVASGVGGASLSAAALSVSSPALAASLPPLRKAVSDGSIPNSPVVMVLSGTPAGAAASGCGGGGVPVVLALGASARPSSLLLHSGATTAGGLARSLVSSSLATSSSSRTADIESTYASCSSGNNALGVRKRKKQVSFAASVKRSDGAYVLRAERLVFTAWRAREEQLAVDPAAATATATMSSTAAGVSSSSSFSSSFSSFSSAMTIDSCASSTSGPAITFSAAVAAAAAAAVTVSAEPAVLASPAEVAETALAVEAAEVAALLADEEQDRRPKRAGMSAEEICLQRKLALAAAAVAVPILKLPSFPFAPRAFSAPTAPSIPQTPSLFLTGAQTPATPSIVSAASSSTSASATASAASVVPCSSTSSEAAGSMRSGPSSLLSVCVGYPALSPLASPGGSPILHSIGGNQPQQQRKHARDPSQDDMAVRRSILQEEDDDAENAGSSSFGTEAGNSSSGSGDSSGGCSSTTSTTDELHNAPSDSLSPEQRVSSAIYQQLLPQPLQLNSPASFTSLSLMTYAANSTSSSARFPAHQTLSVPVSHSSPSPRAKMAATASPFGSSAANFTTAIPSSPFAAAATTTVPASPFGHVAPTAAPLPQLPFQRVHQQQQQQRSAGSDSMC